MNAKQFEMRKEFARKLVHERGLTAEEIAMILWDNACVNCYYHPGVTRCEGKDCSLGVKLGAKEDFEGVYDFSTHREINEVDYEDNTRPYYANEWLDDGNVNEVEDE